MPVSPKHKLSIQFAHRYSPCTPHTHTGHFYDMCHMCALHTYTCTHTHTQIHTCTHTHTHTHTYTHTHTPGSSIGLHVGRHFALIRDTDNHVVKQPEYPLLANYGFWHIAEGKEVGGNLSCKAMVKQGKE